MIRYYLITSRATGYIQFLTQGRNKREAWNLFAADVGEGSEEEFIAADYPVPYHEDGPFRIEEVTYLQSHLINAAMRRHGPADGVSQDVLDEVDIILGRPARVAN